MLPTSAKQKALALKKLPRNRTRDCEYDIYDHLRKKNRVLKNATEKFNYLNTLLQEFEVKDPKGDPELVQFMDGLHGVLKSQVLRLQNQKRKNAAEENSKEDEEDVTVDPGYKYFLDHLRPHGKSYILDIPEDGVLVIYESKSSPPESTAICTIDNANHVSNEEVNVCLDTLMQVNGCEEVNGRKAAAKSPNVNGNHVASDSHKHRGKKPKGAKLHAPENGNVRSSDMTSKAQKHAGNCMVKRRSKRLKKHATRFTQTECQNIDIPGGIATRVIVIYDSDEETTDIRRSLDQDEHCWQDNKEKARILFKEKLMQKLKMPYCEDECERLLQDITVRKPVQHHKDLRGRIKIYEEDYLGMSYLDHHVDLAEKIASAHEDHPRVLNLLRGFFYWLKNLSHEGSFEPWRDPSCLDVLSQQ